MKIRKDLEGESIILRCIDESDADFIVRIRQDKKLNALSAGQISLEGHHQWYERYLKKTDDVYWVVLDKATGNRIGTGALYNIDFQSKKAESGRTILLQEFGYCLFEVFYLRAQHAFNYLGLNKMYAKVREHEDELLRQYIKLGYSKEGLMREDFWDGEQFVSLYLISLLKEEFMINHAKYERYQKMITRISK